MCPPVAEQEPTGIEPLIAGGHDTSVVAVCEGDAEVGVAFDDARGAAETDCDVASNVVVFAYGPEIRNDGWAVAGDLPAEMKEQIKQALLDFAGTEALRSPLSSAYIAPVVIVGGSEPAIRRTSRNGDAIVRHLRRAATTTAT